MAHPAAPISARPSRVKAPSLASSPAGAATAVVGAIVVAALYFGRVVFVPLALAILLGFALAPVVDLFRRWRLGRVPSVLLAVLLALLVLFGIGALIGNQVAQLAADLPQYQTTIREKLRLLRGSATGNGVVERASKMLSNLSEEISKPSSEPLSKGSASAPKSAAKEPLPVVIQEPSPTPFEVLRNVLSPLLEPIATMGVVIVFLVFILLQRQDLRDRFIRLAGARDIQRTTEALDDAASRLSRYLLVQSAINACFGMVIGIGLWIIGVPNAVLWGVLAMMLRFVPYIGAVIAAAFPAILAMAVDPGWSMLLWTIGLFLVAEPITGQVIEPWLYGQSTGLSAVAVVVAATFWTWLWGPVGLLLSTPLTVCVVVLGRHVDHLQFLEVLLGDQPPLSPEESLYLRLLAGDADEAAAQAEEFIKERSLADYLDEVVMKALALAQQDVNRGKLDHERRVTIRNTVEEVIRDIAERDEPATSRDEVAGPPLQPSVLCVAGRGSLDDAAAMLLCEMLRANGLAAQTVPSGEASAPNVYRPDGRGAQLVFLSYLEAGGFGNARRLGRRIRRAAPSAKIVAAFWGLKDDATQHENAAAAAGVDAVASSVKSAVALALELQRPDAPERLPSAAE